MSNTLKIIFPALLTEICKSANIIANEKVSTSTYAG